MVGFSLGKLLFLIIIIVVVWNGFKYVQRVEEMRRLLKREMRRRTAGGEAAPQRPVAAEDLVKCQGCGTYVAAGSHAACGRPNCPLG